MIFNYFVKFRQNNIRSKLAANPLDSCSRTSNINIVYLLAILNTIPNIPKPKNQLSRLTLARAIRVSPRI